MDTALLIRPLTHFLEVAQGIDRERKLAKLQRPLQRALATAFRAQGKDFVKRLDSLKGEFDKNAEAREVGPGFRSLPQREHVYSGRLIHLGYHDENDNYITLYEAPRQEDWENLWQGTVDKTTDLLTDPLGEAIFDALILGGGDLLAGLGITDDEMEEFGIAWNLENPEAVVYAEEHAAEQVALINDTTRSGINSILVEAVESGWSYERVSEMIGDRFEEMATGGDNPRSRRIAVYELGDAYEAATEVLGNQLVGAGLEMEKKWLTVGDNKVRPTHKENEAQGYIPFADDFSSGDSRPPTDPGCRCTTLIRRAGSG